MKNLYTLYGLVLFNKDLLRLSEVLRGMNNNCPVPIAPTTTDVCSSLSIHLNEDEITVLKLSMPDMVMYDQSRCNYNKNYRDDQIQKVVELRSKWHRETTK